MSSHVSRNVLCLTSLIALALALCGGAEEPKSTLPKDFVALYDGKDLSGWEVQDGRIEAWKADGEILSCVAEGGGWLRTTKQYSDFILKVDYRIPPGGNSGV